MNTDLKNKIIQSLKDQKEIFGDELFEENILKRKTIIVKKESTAENKNEASESLFEENWKSAKTLDELESMINTCTKCPLHRKQK